MRVARNLLTQALQQYPFNPAISIGNNEYSYHTFFGGLCDTVDSILSQTAITQPAIAVLADKTLDGYRAVAGAFLSGWTYVPLNSKYPNSRNREILLQSGASILFVASNLRDQGQSLIDELNRRVQLVVFEHDDNDSLVIEVIGDAVTSAAKPMDTALDDIAYLLFTSGSTGNPKGVPVRHSNLAAYLDNIGQVFEFSEHDRFSQFFDFTFDLSVHDMLVCWKHGACLCAPDATATLMPLHFAQRQKITIWFSVPSLALTAKDLLRDKFASFELETVRCSLFCGEALPQSLAAQWHAMTQSPVINLYGPTEATIAFTAHQYRIEEDNHSVVPIGKPFGTNKVAVLNPQGCTVEQGELCLLGEQVFEGYWQRPDLTTTAFHHLDGSRCYRSGDVVTLGEDEVLIYHGRQDRQVQVGGYRVELQEVEHVLRSIIESGTLAVIPHPVSEIGEAIGLVAFIGEQEVDLEAISNECNSRLPAYMVPNRFVALAEFPYNASGKLDYKRLKQMADQA